MTITIIMIIVVVLNNGSNDKSNDNIFIKILKLHCALIVLT